MSSYPMKQFAPAKINLYLHILGKRPDGFHELETLMAPISFGDDLDIERAPSGIHLSCTNQNLPLNEDNLAYRAAAIFLKEFKIDSGVSISLEKRIPIGAGLGGGSSNAAAVLLALRKLFAVEATDEHLARLAAQLGSDIPFFIYEGKAAVCKGRGEIIEPLKLQGKYQGLLVHPGFGVSTPWAYKTYAANPLRGVAGKQTVDNFILRNDLETAAFSKYLWLPAAKMWFQQQPEVYDSLMSGSGSSVFALTHDEAGIEPLRQRFLAEHGAELFATGFKVAV